VCQYKLLGFKYCTIQPPKYGANNTTHQAPLVVRQLLKLGKLMYYITTKEYGRQVLRPTSTRAGKCPNPQEPRLTGTQSAPTNQHPHFSCIENEHLTSDKEISPNKRRSHHLTNKRLHVFPLTHSAEQ